MYFWQRACSLEDRTSPPSARTAIACGDDMSFLLPSDGIVSWVHDGQTDTLPFDRQSVGPLASAPFTDRSGASKDSVWLYYPLDNQQNLAERVDDEEYQRICALVIMEQRSAYWVAPLMVAIGYLGSYDLYMILT